MVLTILIAVVAGKIQKKAQKAEAENFAAHQVAQQEAARQTEELRQQQENLRTAQMAAAQKQQELGTAAALKAYKELLDSGVITQEDFDAKKKELLGM
ncbi:MAG: SHOCT domain-containing protein [Clostridiales bacterium]|nr:SHOCT domain-containing protein [Clostridiales bacterium]